MPINNMTKSSLTFLGLSLSLFTSVIAQANELCDSSSAATINQEQCLTAAAGTTAGIGSGIYAAKKFQTAKSVEETNTKTLFDRSLTPNPSQESWERFRQINEITDGDKITVGYQLSELENRQYHIELMESRARSAESSADSERYRSYTAMKDVYEDVTYQDANGNSQTRREYRGQEPDYMARAMHASNAADYEREAMRYRRAASEARSGAPVPTYDFEKVIADSQNNRNLTVDFVKERHNRGSRLMFIKRLPSNFAKIVRTTTLKGWGGVAGAAAGVIFVGEELLAGHIADQVRKEKGLELKADSYRRFGY